MIELIFYSMMIFNVLIVAWATIKLCADPFEYKEIRRTHADAVAVQKNLMHLDRLINK